MIPKQTWTRTTEGRRDAVRLQMRCVVVAFLYIAAISAASGEGVIYRSHFRRGVVGGWAARRRRRCSLVAPITAGGCAYRECRDRRPVNHTERTWRRAAEELTPRCGQDAMVRALDFHMTSGVRRKERVTCEAAIVTEFWSVGGLTVNRWTGACDFIFPFSRGWVVAGKYAVRVRSKTPSRKILTSSFKVLWLTLEIAKSKKGRATMPGMKYSHAVRLVVDK
jgi:hypothetical protein